jgi:hypothetical protein
VSGFSIDARAENIYSKRKQIQNRQAEACPTFIAKS